MRYAGIAGVPLGTHLLTHVNPVVFRLLVGVLLAGFSGFMLQNIGARTGAHAVLARVQPWYDRSWCWLHSHWRSVYCSKVAAIEHHHDRSIGSITQRGCRVNVQASSPPINCATMNHGASAGLMPEKVSVIERAAVTAGFANEVDDVNQYAAVM